VRQFGHDGAVFGYAVAVDPAGRVLVGGWSNQDLASSDHAIGRWRAFVRDFGRAGDGTSVRQFGTSDGEKPLSIALGPAGDVFVATSGTLAAGAESDSSKPSGSANDVLLVRFPPLP